MASQPLNILMVVKGKPPLSDVLKLGETVMSPLDPTEPLGERTYEMCALGAPCTQNSLNQG